MIALTMAAGPASAADFQERRQPADCTVEVVTAIQVTEGIIDAGNLFSGHARIAYDTDTRDVMLTTVTGVSLHDVGEWIFQFPNGDIGSLTNAQFIDVYEGVP